MRASPALRGKRIRTMIAKSPRPVSSMDPVSLPTETCLLLEQLLGLLRQVFGSRVELADYTIGNRHRDYLVLLARLCHPSIEVVVKLAGPQAPMACPFDRTAMLHRLVAAHTTIPMPEVVAVDASYQTWSWRYLIKRHLPGYEWATVREQMNAHELADAYQQIGNAVAQLHMIQFPAFGELDADGSVQGCSTYVTALAERAQHTIRSDHLRALFMSVLNERTELFTDVREASLCHQDLHKHNILFQYRQGRWHLVTILDFNNAWAGHRETDLARLDFWDGMVSEEFWSAYEALRPVASQYEQRRPIYQLLWCFEYARPTKKHLADTQGLCAALGLSRIEHSE